MTLLDLVRDGLVGWPDIAMFGLCMALIGGRLGVTLGRVVEQVDPSTRRRP